MTAAESRPLARDGVPAPDDVRERVDELDAPAQERIRAEEKAAHDAASRGPAKEAAEGAAEDVADDSHPAPEPPD